MAESDWDTVTVLRKKGPTAAQAKSKQVRLRAGPRPRSGQMDQAGGRGPGAVGQGAEPGTRTGKGRRIGVGPGRGTGHGAREMAGLGQSGADVGEGGWDEDERRGRTRGGYVVRGVGSMGLGQGAGTGQGGRETGPRRAAWVWTGPVPRRVGVFLRLITGLRARLGQGLQALDLWVWTGRRVGGRTLGQGQGWDGTGAGWGPPLRRSIQSSGAHRGTLQAIVSFYPQAEVA